MGLFFKQDLWATSLYFPCTQFISIGNTVAWAQTIRYSFQNSYQANLYLSRRPSSKFRSDWKYLCLKGLSD
jgi:hypothetical protein